MDSQAAKPQTAVIAGEGLVTRAQLAAEIGVSEQTIAAWEKEGLPVHRRGAQRFYEAARVAAWIKRGGR